MNEASRYSLANYLSLPELEITAINPYQGWMYCQSKLDHSVCPHCLTLNH